MSHEAYFRKFRIFREEALKDIEIGAYNKAVSALWFSVEALLRGLLLKMGKNPPERSGKLINISMGILFQDVENATHLSRLLTSLHYQRREVDHRKRIADKTYAEISLKKYNEVISIITKKYPWIKRLLT